MKQKSELEEKINDVKKIYSQFALSVGTADVVFAIMLYVVGFIDLPTTFLVYRKIRKHLSIGVIKTCSLLFV
jgi:hypothetical protein